MPFCSRTSRQAVLAFLICFTAVLSGCGGGHGGGSGSSSSSGTIALSLLSQNVTAGASVQLLATETTTGGVTTNVTQTANYTSGNPLVATVNATGLLTALNPGSVFITATAGEATGSMTVVVGDPLVTAFAVTPAAVNVLAGGTQQYIATLTYANGTTAAVTNQTTWTVNPTSVASINSTGLLTAVSAGSFTISATASGQSATQTGTVSPVLLTGIAITPASPSIAPGATLQFTATGSYNNGSKGDLTTSVNWVSSDPSHLSINAAGLATGQSNITSQTINISASLSGITKTVPVTLTAGAAMTNLIVTPTSSSIATTSAEQHKATAFYADGTEQDVTRSVTWSSATVSPSNLHGSALHSFSSAPSRPDSVDGKDAGDSNDVDSVDSTGVDTAGSPGMATVQASMDGMSANSTVIVTSATPVSLAINSSDQLLPVGSQQAVTLTGNFSDGSTQDLSLTANWQSSNPAVATIDQTGMITAISAGTFTVSAGFDGLSAQSGMDVSSSALVSTTIAARYPADLTGLTQPLSLIGTYADGTTQDLTSVATFTSSNPNVFAVDLGGTAYGTSQGTAQITATVGGLSAISNFASFTDPLLTVTVLPPSVRIALGTHYPFTAQAVSKNGFAIDVTYPSVWRSADPTILTIGADGLAKAGSLGTTTVSATVLGVSGTSQTIEVTNATLKNILLTDDHQVLTTSTIATGTNYQYTAAGLYSDGSIQDITRDVIWTTSDLGIAFISAGGNAAGNKAGQVQVTASLNGISTAATLNVTNATLVSTAISPGNAELPVGIYRQFALVGTFSDGSTQNLTANAIFQAPTPSIVSLVPQGLVLGVGPGVGQINAQLGYFNASTPVKVTNVALTALDLSPASSSIRLGGDQLFVATGTFSDGYTQDLAGTVTFSSSSSTIAFPAYQLGDVVGEGVGSATVSASLRGMTASTTSFQVLSDTLTSISFSPASPTLVAGTDQQMTAIATYDDGTTDTLTNVVWTSSNPAVLSVSSTGLLTAYSVLNPTTVTISVQFTNNFGVVTNATFTATVDPATPTPPGVTLQSLAVTPTSVHLAAGTQQQLTATATLSDGTKRNVSSAATWSSDNTAVATVSSSGLVTSVAPGSATIQAQLGTQTASSVVTATAATLSSIAISPSGASFAAGATQQFTLTGTFTDGTQQNLTSSTTWSTSNSAVASISAAGLATGVSAGSVTFSANYGGLNTTTAVSMVTPATLVSIAVSPNTVSFAKGTSQQFTVTGTYSDGTTRVITSQASFLSSNVAVLSVTSTGLATGTGSGSASITVTVNGISVTTQSVMVTPATLTSISVTPNSPSIASGTSQQFTATGTFSDGSTQDLSTQVVWTSSNPQVLAINSAGDATTDGTGSATLTATFNGTSTTSGTISVTPAALSGITLSPTSAQIAKGTSQSFTATGVFTDGTTQNLTTQAAWTSSNGTVASVDANGLATGNAPGSAQITASYGGKSASTSSFVVTSATLVSLSFSPANPTVATNTSSQLQVFGSFSDGTTQNLTSSSTFSSSNPQVASISPAGVITGVAPGSTTITISAGGQSDTVNVTVSNAVLTGIAITPNPPSAFAKGTTEQFTATGTYSDGTTQDLSNTTTWTSSNPAVFTIDANGLATGTGVGSASLTATNNGKTATTSTFNVTPATVASVTVSPQGSSVVINNTVQYAATATYTDGTTQDVSTSTTWASSNPGVASISTTGLATGIAAGSTVVSAQASSQTGQSTLTVTSTQAPTLQQIVVTSASNNPNGVRRNAVHARSSAASIVTGQTQQFIATGVYSDQSMADLSTQVSWSSTNPNIATVNGTGLASSVAAGSTNIDATLNGLTGMATLTVTSAPVVLNSISIAPSAGNVAAGGTQQFTATGYYSDGSLGDLTTSVNWLSSNPAVATIGAANGLATAVGGGNTSISATSGSMSATATLTVSPAMLQSLTVTPQSASIANGTSQQYKAIGNLSDGSTQDLTTSVNWNSSNTALSLINASGLASTMGTGTLTITATAGTVSASTPLTITTATSNTLQLTPNPISLPAGGVQQLLATATFSDGTSQNVTSSTTYSSSNTSVATVDSAGRVHAVSPGTATITGTQGAASATTAVTVQSAVLQSMTITPANPSAPVGESQQLTATGNYSDGSTENLTSVANWTSSDPSDISVSSTGNVIILHAVAATITAGSGNITGTTTVTGTAAVATAISVSPANQTLAAGTTQQFAATATLSDNSQQNVTASAHWSVSDPSKASISNTNGSNGLFTATAAGSVNVVASVAAGSSTISGQGTVTVTAATLTGLTINPSATITIPAGTLKQLSVTGMYSDGSSSDVTSIVTWSTGQASTAYVDSSALLHGVSSGVTTINAVLSGVTGTSVVSVGTATLSSIAVTPASPALALGQTAQLTATGTYSDGSTSNLTSQVEWTSSAPAVASISNSGLLTTLTTGHSNLTATLNGTSGSTALTVSNATLTSIVIQAGETSFALGTSLQLQAVGYYSDGSSQNLTSTVHWSSLQPAVGIVSATGLATGVSTGSFTVMAASNGVSGTTSLAVTNATLSSITVTTANTNVVNIAGQTVQFYATGTFSDGSTQNLTNYVHWATTGVVVGTINQSGVFTPTGVGAGRVTATSGTIVGSISFTVVSVPLL